MGKIIIRRRRETVLLTLVSLLNPLHAFVLPSYVGIYALHSSKFALNRMDRVLARFWACTFDASRTHNHPSLSVEKNPGKAKVRFLSWKINPYFRFSARLTLNNNSWIQFKPFSIYPWTFFPNIFFLLEITTIVKTRELYIPLLDRFCTLMFVSLSGISQNAGVGLGLLFLALWSAIHPSLNVTPVPTSNYNNNGIGYTRRLV